MVFEECKVGKIVGLGGKSVEEGVFRHARAEVSREGALKMTESGREDAVA